MQRWQSLCSLHLLLLLYCVATCDSGVADIPDGVRRFHDGRVIFDLLAALRSEPGPITNLGFNEYASTFQGDTKALVFREPNRIGQINKAVTKEIMRALAGARDFTFLFTLKQNSTNVGTLVSFTSENNRRLLELQSAWRKEELRLHYVMNQATNMIHVEKLAYQLADNLWHQVAVTVTGNQVALLVDCQKIYDRVLYRPINEDLFRRNAALWLGQRGRWSSYFQGEMQEAMIVIGQHGSLEQCPHMESLCPTCGQHKLLAQAVELMQSEIHRVKMQLKATEKRLEQLAQCDCIVRCPHNGTFYEDGQTWDIGNCRQCTCQKGRVTCGPNPCPVVTCAFPVRMKGSCCPSCLRSCDLHGVVGGSGGGGFEHGMNVTSLSEIDSGNNRICVHCQCKDGSLECFEPTDHRTICPVDDCPAAQQKTNSFDCCPYCEGYDHCAKGHKCSPNADCVNLHNRHDCVCRPGYHGNGQTCVDIDECLATTAAVGVRSNVDKNKCGNNTECVNTPGSYECPCKLGFSRETPFTCRDTDECTENNHRCSENAICTNTHGAHSCQCKVGYYGDGFNCLPICPAGCINGGSCVKPGICGCPFGFHGARCELDLDECSLGLHRCHANSQCQNLPGGYHCVCRSGFTDSGRDNLFGTLCRDENECAGRRGKDFTCSPGTRCINTVGGYKCLCHSGYRCDTHCTYKVSPHRRQRISSGSSIRDLIDPCLLCSCYSGYLNCSKMQCNCTSLSGSLEAKCCPQCLAGNVTTGVVAMSCADIELGKARPSGSRWIRDCETCYCLAGETQCHPIKCPPISCPHPVTRPGSCCPTCPHADPCRTGQAPLATMVARGVRRQPLLGELLPRRRSGCLHEGRRVGDGTRWSLPAMECVACECRDGHICCSHDDRCELTTPAASTVAATQSPSSATFAASTSTASTTSQQRTATSGREASTRATTTSTDASLNDIDIVDKPDADALSSRSSNVSSHAAIDIDAGSVDSNDNNNTTTTTLDDSGT